MKNLKNIIASIILVVISFVSYTQYQYTLEYKFYLTDSTENVNTFNVLDTVTNNNVFTLSEETWELGELNSSTNFSMDSTIYKNTGVINTIDSAYVTGIFLISEDYQDYQNFDGDLKQLYFLLTEELLGDNILYIDNVEDFITTLRDTSKTYVHVVFKIEYGFNTAYTSFAIEYSVAEEETDTTLSIDTEVIEVSNTRVYPNPVMNSLNIEFETINTDTEVEIYSTSGQLMYKDVEYRNFGINKVSVDMSNYQPGMYIVKLGNVVKKVIKQ